MTDTPVSPRPVGVRRARWIAVLLVVVVALVSQGCAVQMPWAQKEEETPLALPAYQPTKGESAPAAREAAPAAAEPAAAPPAANESASSASSSARLGALTYSGEIVAEQQVRVTAETAGRVLEVGVDVGDRVAMGQMLVRTDTAILEAQREQALAGLMAAQSQLDLLLSDPEAADLAAAQAALNAAGAGYQRAVDGASAEDLTMALAQVRQAEAAVNVAQAAYNQVKGNPSIGMLPQSMQLQQATIGLEAARAQYEKVAKGATSDVIAGAYAQVSNARAQLERLQRGPKAAQVRAAEAQVKQAETGLYMTQLQLDKATVKAPIDGIVSQMSITAGSMAGPGAPLLTLVSPEVKLVIAVEEAALGSLRIGQAASIQVAAWPMRTFEGTVKTIAPALDPATRTVQVTIIPSGEAQDTLIPGMSATVTLLEAAQ
jgi:multidrug resistance efflux pump